MRAGCVVFPISPRNSAVAVAHLVNKTRAQHVFVSPDPANQCLIKAASESLHDSFKFNVHSTPTFEDLFPTGDGSLQEEFFVAPKRSANDIAAIFHSSGERLAF